MRTKLEFVCTERLVAYDADTGQVLGLHETSVECTDGARNTATSPPTQAALEAFRREKARSFEGRRVEALALPEGFVYDGRVRYRVDPVSRQIYESAVRSERFPSLGEEADS